jgi:hypothetical protein
MKAVFNYKGKVLGAVLLVLVLVLTVGLALPATAQNELPFTVVVLDHANNPVQGATIGVNYVFKKTDAAGEATFSVKPKDTGYTVSVSNFVGQTYGPYKHPQNGGGTLVQVRLSKVTWVVKDEQGNPVQGAIVNFYNNFQRTDAEGKTSRLVPAATTGSTLNYSISYASTTGKMESFTVSYCEDKEVEYKGLVVIPVKLVDANGNPLANKNIYRDPGFTSPQKTDANGRVNWKYGPRGGTITLKAEVPGDDPSWTATIPDVGPVPGPTFQVP